MPPWAVVVETIVGEVIALVAISILTGGTADTAVVSADVAADTAGAADTVVVGGEVGGEAVSEEIAVDNPWEGMTQCAPG